jgi:arylformamidase
MMDKRLRTATIALAAAATLGAAWPADGWAAPKRTAPKQAPALRVEHDVIYGNDPAHRFDVYRPARPVANAPVVFMVHGGGWAVGDKAGPGVAGNKAKRWVPKGMVVVSTNYRLGRAAGPLDQARDVASALALAQKEAPTWGGDPNRFILMGHSSGGHLVALLAASKAIREEFGVKPVLGTVILDGAALDTEITMRARHPGFYDRAFGSNPAYWTSASPYHVLAEKGPPILAVCSPRSCGQAGRFVQKAASLGTRAVKLEQRLSHKEINQRLGADARYTGAVEAFLRTLDRSVASALEPGRERPAASRSR